MSDHQQAKVEREITRPKPFNLLTEQRGKLYQDAFKAKIKEEQNAASEKRLFHAQPANVLQKHPWEPCLLPKPPTVLISPNLHVDKRAVERRRFDEGVAAKQALFERNQMELRLAEEKKAIRELRKQQEFKARPIHRRGRERYEPYASTQMDKEIYEPYATPYIIESQYSITVYRF